MSCAQSQGWINQWARYARAYIWPPTAWKGAREWHAVKILSISRGLSFVISTCNVYPTSRYFDYNGLLKNCQIFIVRCIFELKNFVQIRFRPGLGPGSRCGSLQRPLSRPLDGWEWATPSLPLPLDAFSVSISTPSAPCTLEALAHRFRRSGVRRAHQRINLALGMYTVY